MKMYNPFGNLKRHEWLLWGTSVLVVAVSAIFAGKEGLLNSIASIVGVTSLIFIAKGDPFGQGICIVFSFLYGIISIKFRYYGEAITYLCMACPASLVSLISWLRHPYTQNEVKVATLNKRKIALIAIFSLLITILFYFILMKLGNANLLVSTLSIFTSALAGLLLIFRSPWYAAAYSANDIVLIILWILAAMESVKYLPMIFCFVMFLANDLYGFFNWKKMKKEQK